MVSSSLLPTRFAWIVQSANRFHCATCEELQSFELDGRSFDRPGKELPVMTNRVFWCALVQLTFVSQLAAQTPSLVALTDEGALVLFAADRPGEARSIPASGIG